MSRSCLSNVIWVVYNQIMNITFCEEEKEDIHRKHPSAELVSVE